MPTPNLEIFGLWESGENGIYEGHGGSTLAKASNNEFCEEDKEEDFCKEEDQATIQYVTISRRHEAMKAPNRPPQKEKAALPSEKDPAIRHLRNSM